MDKQDPKINVSSINTSSTERSSLGEIPPLNAQRDDPHLSKLASSNEAYQTASAGNALHQSDNSSSWMLGLIILLFFAVTIVGYGAYILYNQVIELQNEGQSQQQAISQLQQTLSSTGESATSSLDALTVKDNEQDSEIRKLWDVSNKRNKKQIASNRKQLASLSSSVTASKKQLSLQENKLTQVIRSQTSLEDSINTMKGSQLETLERQVKENLQASTSADLAIAQNREENQQQLDLIKSLQTQIDRLKQQNQSDELLSIQLSLDDIQARLNRLETRQ